MAITWLIIANATHAFIYDISNKKKHLLLTELDHPEGRLKNQDLVTDRPGNFGPLGQGAFVQDTTPHETVLIDFAEKIAHYLEQEGSKKHFDHLIIAAEPHFYGILEKHLSKHIASLIKHGIKKDYVPLPAADLDRAIEDIQHEYF